MMANTVVWIDIPAGDIDRAARFYSAVLGAEVPTHEEHFGKMGFLPGMPDGVSGCLYECGTDRPSRDGILVYMNAEGRLDDAIAAVAPNGGEVLTPRESIAPHGWRAIIVDSEGNRVALHSMT